MDASDLQEFKITLLRKLSEVQESTDTQLNEPRKIMENQDVQQIDRNHKKYQTEILELKNKIVVKYNREVQHQAQSGRGKNLQI